MQTRSQSTFARTRFVCIVIVWISKIRNLHMSEEDDDDDMPSRHAALALARWWRRRCVMYYFRMERINSSLRRPPSHNVFEPLPS